MFTVSGVTFPDEARPVMRAARDAGLSAIIANPHPIGRQCPNCSGLQSIALVLYDAKKASDHKPGRFIDGAWRETTNHFFYCPICTDNSKRIEHLIRASGLDYGEASYRLDWFNKLTPEQYKPRSQAIQAAHEILSAAPTPTGWLSVYGSFGTGKSGILKSLTAQLCLTGCRAHYVTATTMLEEYRASYDKDNSQATQESAANITRRYLSYQFLAIDEIDKPQLTAWTKERLFALFDERYRAEGEQCTVIATNSNPGALADDLKYLESRMKDGKRVIMGGVDLRGKK